ncbi:hypothetical protein QJQ45_002098 [Haematococcus lacustris]|nr:hypothetical protein QJQ45_002098 [Haematococcus lacustris]
MRPTGNAKMVLNVPTQAPLQQAFQQHARGADYSNTSAKEAARFTREQLKAYLLYHKVPPRDQPVGNTLVAGWQKAVQDHGAPVNAMAEQQHQLQQQQADMQQREQQVAQLQDRLHNVAHTYHKPAATCCMAFVGGLCEHYTPAKERAWQPAAQTSAAAKRGRSEACWMSLKERQHQLPRQLWLLCLELLQSCPCRLADWLLMRLFFNSIPYEPQHQQHQHQARRSRRSGQSSCWANATSVAAAADVEDGLRSQRPTQLAQCPPKAHDVMAAAVGEAVLAAAAMVAAAEAAQQEMTELNMTIIDNAVLAVETQKVTALTLQNNKYISKARSSIRNMIKEFSQKFRRLNCVWYSAPPGYRSCDHYSLFGPDIDKGAAMHPTFVNDLGLLFTTITSESPEGWKAVTNALQGLWQVLDKLKLANLQPKSILNIRSSCYRRSVGPAAALPTAPAAPCLVLMLLVLRLLERIGGADERVGCGWTVGRSPCGGEQPQIAQRGAQRRAHKLTKFNAGFNAVSGHTFAICPFEAHCSVALEPQSPKGPSLAAALAPPAQPPALSNWLAAGLPYPDQPPALQPSLAAALAPPAQPPALSNRLAAGLPYPTQPPAQPPALQPSLAAALAPPAQPPALSNRLAAGLPYPTQPPAQPPALQPSLAAALPHPTQLPAQLPAPSKKSKGDYMRTLSCFEDIESEYEFGLPGVRPPLKFLEAEQGRPHRGGDKNYSDQVEYLKDCVFTIKMVRELEGLTAKELQQLADKDFRTAASQSQGSNKARFHRRWSGLRKWLQDKFPKHYQAAREMKKKPGMTAAEAMALMDRPVESVPTPLRLLKRGRQEQGLHSPNAQSAKRILFGELQCEELGLDVAACANTLITQLQQQAGAVCGNSQGQAYKQVVGGVQEAASTTAAQHHSCSVAQLLLPCLTAASTTAASTTAAL